MIARAEAQDAATDALRELILAAYAPGGPGFEALCEELRSAPILRERRTEVHEVIASLQDGRDYVAICGALPLAEGALAVAYGRWRKDPAEYPLRERLFDADALTTEETADLLKNKSALDMVMHCVDDLWDTTSLRPGTLAPELNRHIALHGTGHGWSTRDNAVRTVLLLAAAVRVADPLLGPRPARADPRA
jgi:hypothetical protein